MEYAFHVCNTMSPLGMARAIKRMLGDGDAPPVLLCIGSDLAIGDSLGPIVGTMVRRTASACGGYVYGTLRAPVTAKEVRYVREFLRQTHPNAKIIAVDAAVGEESEIGLIKLSDTPLRPGSGSSSSPIPPSVPDQGQTNVWGKWGTSRFSGFSRKSRRFPMRRST